MKIIDFSLDNSRDGWHLSKVQFDDINLLVGLSGVGKSRILGSIVSLKHIANGRTLNGIKWSLNFLASDNNTYSWVGEFSAKRNMVEMDDDEDDEDNDLKDNKSTILFEKLICNGIILLDRKNGSILFKDDKVPKLNPNKSAIYLLKEDPINLIVNELNKISLYDHTDPTERQMYFFGYDRKKLLKDYKSLNDIVNSKLDMTQKMYWLFSKEKELFNKIESIFCNIFPFIEAIRIDLLDDAYISTVPSPIRDIPFIQIKEKNIDKWIPQINISAGMFNALLLLCELYLCTENSVILIDELENSLGINCLGAISDEIVANTRNTQFIITSHHPTIINNIDYNTWKIVTRKANNVSVCKYGIDITESAHDPYLQLINSIQYNDGITN